jgi:hypothetical protein
MVKVHAGLLLDKINAIKQKNLLLNHGLQNTEFLQFGRRVKLPTLEPSTTMATGLIPMEKLDHGRSLIGIDLNTPMTTTVRPIHGP